jgi:fermentation-respiration switch protein FrsA (DUF1100 family)
MYVPSYIAWPVVLLVGWGVLYLAATRAAYYPLRYPDGYWSLRTEIGASEVWLHTADGVRLNAWWIPSSQARVITLFLHGNAGNITHREGHIRAITSAGSSLLILDYRGYGKSEGRPTERGLYQDAAAAYQYLLDHGYSGGQIVLHGESLGSAVAVDLASRRPCAGVVLEAPFTSGADVARSVLPVLGPLLFRGFDARGKIGRIHVPLLVINGDVDDVIPPALGKALFAAANDPKTFWQIPGAGHNDIVEAAGPAYRERLHTFYATLPPPAR